jgi:DNA-directed RNA polymerase subunit H (RpoH/RPB5)
MTSVNPHLLSVKKDSSTITETVLLNIVKMFRDRGWVFEENIDKYTQQLIKNINDNNIFKLRLDVEIESEKPKRKNSKDSKKKEEDNFDGKIVVIKILPEKITSIVKSPIIGDFIDKNRENHKLLIVNSISDKSKRQLLLNKNMEVFVEEFLMQNLLSHVCSPKYEILSKEESEAFLKEYNALKKQMKNMFDSDPASMYLNLKINQIVRITRDSEVTGFSIDYRIVVPKS